MSSTPEIPADVRKAVKPADVTVVIGLEIHVQLETQSKLFCACSTQYGAEPNTQTCPVCTGMPGSLPVVNAEALKKSIKAGLAMGCEIARYTKWDRKNYFYPDLPKGYQISQLDKPICGEGELTAFAPKGEFEPRLVRIERAHLEEDAGKSIHEGKKKSKIDLNRTGTPLLEIVTRPDLRSPDEAKAFLTELKLILTYAGVSDCNMQQGNLRCDGNINLHINVDGQTIATPIVEIKNLNSFRNAERALAYESKRQLKQWKKDGIDIKAGNKRTVGWSDADQETIPQREKEEAADYRYFPDPDLIAVTISESEIEALREEIGTLPGQWREILQSEHGLKEYDTNVIVSQGQEVVDFFLSVAKSCGDSKLACNWVTQEVLRYLNECDIEIANYPPGIEGLSELLKSITDGKLDNRRGKEVLQEMIDSGSSVQAAMDKLGIKQVDAGELDALCQQIIDAPENANVIQQIKDGNSKAIGALIGKAKKLNPNANLGLVKNKIEELLQ